MIIAKDKAFTHKEVDEASGDYGQNNL